MDSHKLYSYRYADGRYTVSIANRACVEEAIAALCRDLDIRSAAITGSGTLEAADSYNVTTLHLHDTLGRADYTALAGHLLSARINGAGEIFITPFDAATPRRYDPVTGLNIYDFQ